MALAGLVAALASLLALAPLAAAAGETASPSCRPGFTCPNPAGRVEVTLAGFDGSGVAANEAGVLDADEIQCALDCLDGDPDPDHVPAGPGGPWTATPVRGGFLALDPSVTYRVRRSLRLPAAAQGMLVIDGRGARLRVQRGEREPVTLLERRAPAGANACDAELMSIWATLWTIENVAFEGDGSPGDTGLAIHGTNSLTVRNCSFSSLGTGLDLRFALVPLVEQCFFVNNRRHDIVLGAGDAECGPSGTCIAPCTTGPAVFTRAGSSTRTLVEGGCNSALVRHCRFVLQAQQVSSIRIRNSRQPVLDGLVFDGVRGKHVVHHSHDLANELTIRDMYFETGVPSDDAVIRFDGGSRLLVQGLHLVTNQRTVAIDTSANRGCSVHVAHVSWCPSNVRFANGTNAWRNDWRFEDVSAGDLASGARWAGGPPPRSLVIENGGLESRPQQAAGHVLTIPVGSPLDHGGKLAPGQLWIDGKTGRLMTCCDAAGRPRPAAK